MNRWLSAMALLCAMLSCSAARATSVHILVVFDQSAFGKHSASQRAALAQQVISAGNASLSASGLPGFTYTYDLYPTAVGFNASGKTTTQVADYMSSTDPSAGSIYTLRYNHAADIVVMIVDRFNTGSPAGGVTACVPSSLSNPFDSQRCALVAIRDDEIGGGSPTGLPSGGGDVVPAHELGHALMGQHHTESSGQNIPVPYNHADVKSRNMTVLAANEASCTSSMTCRWYHFLSSDTKTYPSSSQVRGNASSRDNERLVVQTWPIVADYRRDSPPPPDCDIEVTGVCVNGSPEVLVSGSTGGGFPVQTTVIERKYGSSGWIVLQQQSQAASYCSPHSIIQGITNYLRIRFVGPAGTQTCQTQITVPSNFCDNTQPF